MRPGDALIFYTDGVSEAFNPQDECYGNERLLADAGALAGQSAPAITAGLLQKVRAFAGSAPQSDDIAILTLRVGGGSSGKGGPRMTLELHATPEEVMRAVEALQEFGQAQAGPRESDSSASRWRWRNAAATSSTTPCSATRGRRSA